MSIWDWMIAFARNADQEGDEARLRLYDHFVEALNRMQTEPQAALARLRQVRQVAIEMKEPWWVQLCNHWMLQIKLFFAPQYHTLIEEALEHALAVSSRPEYAGFPQRICLHEDLIHAYRARDPHGYAAEIDQALDYMAQHIQPTYDCYFCLQSHKLEAAIEREAHARAREIGLRYAHEATTAEQQHYIADAYNLLCRLAHQMGDYDSLLKWSLQAESAARDGDSDKALMVALAWQGVAQRHRGEEEMARHLVGGTARLYQRYGAEPDHDYFAALCAFHALRDEHAPALNVRLHQLKLLDGTARYYPECLCRLEIIRLKKALGQDTAADKDALRQLTGHLKDAAPVLARLAALD